MTRAISSADIAHTRLHARLVERLAPGESAAGVTNEPGRYRADLTDIFGKPNESEPAARAARVPQWHCTPAPLQRLIPRCSSWSSTCPETPACRHSLHRPTRCQRAISGEVQPVQPTYRAHKNAVGRP